MTAVPVADLPGLDAGYSPLELEVLAALGAARGAIGMAPWVMPIVARVPEAHQHLAVGVLNRLVARGRVETRAGVLATRYRDVQAAPGPWGVIL